MSLCLFRMYEINNNDFMSKSNQAILCAWHKRGSTSDSVVTNALFTKTLNTDILHIYLDLFDE